MSGGRVFGEGESSAFLALGVDNLDTLEELFGDALGDALVRDLSRRLQPIVPHTAEIRVNRRHRLLIALPQFGRDAILQLVEALQTATASESFETRHGPVALTLSAGCAFGDGNDNLEGPALHALHGAMSGGVASVQIASGDAALLNYRSGLMQASRAAIGKPGSDHLTMAYQPVVRGEGGKIISFHECLARIRTPEGKVLTAASFMPAIERLGLAAMVDRQVLGLACDALANYPLARFSINIFPQTMQDLEWLKILEDRLADDATLAERLIIEVTETSALLDLKRTRAFMDRLRRYGASFAIDDFGAGHTSLGYLRDLRFDMLKIDGSFVRNVDRNPDSAFLIDTLVHVARRFDMMSVAESVQTPAEARCLNDLGVEYFQGFQFGSPSLMLEPTPSPMTMVAAQA